MNNHVPDEFERNRQAAILFHKLAIRFVAIVTIIVCIAFLLNKHFQWIAVPK